VAAEAVAAAGDGWAAKAVAVAVAVAAGRPQWAAKARRAIR
ncbi:MAG: hypothetical protein JWP73_991, partial [Phenylobacterium sp.]|nr:hypothetical protein [Phenylobacterium sp.]